MKTLYLDIFSGISGDMFIGALIDLGVDAHQVGHELEKLGLDGYHLHVGARTEGNIDGMKFDVHLTHDHEHDHEHEHGHSTNMSTLMRMTHRTAIPTSIIP